MHIKRILYSVLVFGLILSPLAGCAPSVTKTPEVIIREVTPAEPTATLYTPPPPTITVEPTSTPLVVSETKPLVQLAMFHNAIPGADLEHLAKDYQMYDLSRTDEPFRDELKSLGSKGTFLLFMSLETIHFPGSCENQPWLNTAAYEIGDFCMIKAQHPDWFLKDTMGNPIIVTWEEETFYYMDPGNQEWLTFAIKRIGDARSKYGWDGLFIDNVDASLTRINEMGITLKDYPTDVSFQNVHAAMLQRIRNELADPQKFLLFANITNITDTDGFYSYMQYLDGAMIENFAVDWVEYHDPVVWKTQLEYIDRAQTYDRKFILVAQGQKDDLPREQFALATYLLINNGGLYFRYIHADHYDQVWDYDNYGVNLGNPTGPYREESGEWIRDFEHGEVRVNPSRQTSSIRVNP